MKWVRLCLLISHRFILPLIRQSLSFLHYIFSTDSIYVFVFLWSIFLYQLSLFIPVIFVLRYKSLSQIIFYLLQTYHDSSNLQEGSTAMARQGIPCVYCGRIFSQACNLRMHVKTVHMGQYEYSCEICGKGIRRRDELRSHILFKHGDQNYASQNGPR